MNNSKMMTIDTKVYMGAMTVGDFISYKNTDIRLPDNYSITIDPVNFKPVLSRYDEDTVTLMFSEQAEVTDYLVWFTLDDVELMTAELFNAVFVEVVR